MDELGEFLRARRARIRPEDVGFPAHGRRRVPGLRRDELAQLAGVSVEYYVRLEQGRGPKVSDEVLDALGRALHLDDTELEYLYTLARPSKRRRHPAQETRVREHTRMLLDSMEHMPAFVLGRRMDVLAWNRLGGAVTGFAAMPPGQRNVVRQVFLDPAARALYPQWPDVAAESVAYLRLDAGRHPDDQKLAALVEELSARSGEFRELWAARDVKEKTFGRKLLNHPVVGELDVRYETLAMPGDPDQLMVTYLAEPGSATAERLALLASWSAEDASDDHRRRHRTHDPR